MRILLTNDDGIHAPGLWYAAAALQTLGQVIISVPDREQSGIGTAITLHHPIRINEVSPYIPGITTYTVEGTPSDAVILALETLIEEKIDLVVSGINQGANLGWDMHISGTFSAALQAYFRGINAIAISVTALIDVPYSPAAMLLSTIIPRLTKASVPSPFLININLPKNSVQEIKGIDVTYPAEAVYQDQINASDDTRRPYYWISRSRPNPDSPKKGTDWAAIRDNRISITPLQTSLFTSARTPDYDKITDHLLETLQSLPVPKYHAQRNTLDKTDEPPWLQSRTRRIKPIRSSAFRLMCSDLEKSVAFYKNLGFQIEQEFTDKGQHRWGATLTREAIIIRCTEQTQYPPERVQAFHEYPHGVGLEIYLAVLGIDSLFFGFKESGIVFSHELQTNTFGAREFEIVDPDGYRLVFSQSNPSS